MNINGNGNGNENENENENENDIGLDSIAKEARRGNGSQRRIFDLKKKMEPTTSSI